ncbi:MAG: acyltransferase [Candidatus Omnitrophica bacterium]|nr:acyltransferase [Candidatus Omnitrophota bacterium]
MIVLEKIKMKTSRIRWIDGARGLAILMVVVVHVAGQMHGLPSALAFICTFGNMGVQLFFLLSAYSACLTNASPITAPSVLIPYYIKRFMRLAPLYWIGILLYFLMASAGIVYGGPIGNYTKWNVLANILLINNVFPSAQNYIVPGGWCIGCFSLFYLLFPVLNRFLESGVLLKTACICALGAAVTGWLLNFTTLPKQYIYWLIVNQIGIFLIGMLYYKDIRLQSKSYIGLQLLFGSGLISVTLLLIHTIGQMYIYRHILAAITFIFVLNALRRYEKLVPDWLVYLGSLSYPIFIIHFAVSWMVLHIINVWILGSFPSVLFLLYVFAIVLISAGFAFFLNWLIEKPCLKLTKLLVGRIRIEMRV